MREKKKGPTPVLCVSGLTIRRDRTHILQNIDWKVEQGEHWALLGSNGSGKTSLLAALTGYLMPTSGRIAVLGEEFGQSDWRALRLRIGLVSSAIRQMIPEPEPALETVVSGKYAMIDYWGKLSSADRAKAHKILEETECGYIANRPWGFLSQGERQRILIGRALMADPDLLILDEPCAGLDPVAREHFLQFLQRLGLKQDGPTLVLVTHHVEEIMPVFSHVLILKEGKILAQGPKSQAMRSTILSDAFHSPVRLRQSKGRFSLTVSGESDKII